VDYDETTGLVNYVKRDGGAGVPGAFLTRVQILVALPRHRWGPRVRSIRAARCRLRRDIQLLHGEGVSTGQEFYLVAQPSLAAWACMRRENWTGTFTVTDVSGGRLSWRQRRGARPPRRHVQCIHARRDADVSGCFRFNQAMTASP